MLKQRIRFVLPCNRILLIINKDVNVGIEDGTADWEYDLAEPPNETILTKDGFESAFRWDDQDICVVSRKYDTMIMVCEQVLEEMATQSPRP